MIILGIRCSSKNFSYSITSGKQDNPQLISHGTIRFPTGYSEAELAKWFYQEIGGIIEKYNVRGIGIKGVEPMAQKGKPFGHRMQLEGLIYLQACEHGIKYISRKVKSTIAKDFGLKGKGKYLDTQADFSNIPGYDDMGQNIQESIQVGLSMLK